MGFTNLITTQDAGEQGRSREPKLLEILERLEHDLATHTIGLSSCSFPRRINHLSAAEVQEGISSASGPEGERLQ